MIDVVLDIQLHHELDFVHGSVSVFRVPHESFVHRAADSLDKHERPELKIPGGAFDPKFGQQCGYGLARG